MRRCSTCGQEKPSTDFHRRKDGPQELAYSCKSCAIAAARRHKQSGPVERPHVATVEKPCNTCGEVKLLNQFHKHKDNRDGLANRCKDCTREAVKRGRTQNSEMYARQKKDSVRYQLERLDPEVKRAREREQYAKTREHRQAKMREQYRKNADAYKLRARARKLRLRNAWTPEGDAWAAVIQRDPCAYCGGKATGVDHIVPIIDGGLHEPDNIVACCPTCNTSKGKRPLLSFLLMRTWVA